MSLSGQNIFSMINALEYHCEINRFKLRIKETPLMPNHRPSVEDLRVSLIVQQAWSPAQTHHAYKWTSIKGKECYHIWLNKLLILHRPKGRKRKEAHKYREFAKVE